MTSSKQWRDIKGLHYLRVCAQGQVTAMVSVSVSGGPVRFRVQVDDDGNFFPQKAEFAPGGGSPKGFSFTFIGSVGTFEGVDEHVFDVQWRSVTGAPVTARARLLNLLYKRGAHC
jgi:hypothetical protein